MVSASSSAKLISQKKRLPTRDKSCKNNPLRAAAREPGTRCTEAEATSCVCELTWLHIVLPRCSSDSYRAYFPLFQNGPAPRCTVLAWRGLASGTERDQLHCENLRCTVHTRSLQASTIIFHEWRVSATGFAAIQTMNCGAMIWRSKLQPFKCTAAVTCR